MKPFSIAVVLAVLLLGGVFLFFFPSPIVLLGGDRVEPTQVRAGDTISVWRNYRVRRDVHLTNTRAMTQGDCSHSCEVIDLRSGSRVLKRGDHIDVRRDHVIPLHTRPGKWTLGFTLSYAGIFGRVVTIELQRLDIEVIP